MDVQATRTRASSAQRNGAPTALTNGDRPGSRAFGSQRIGQILGEWHAREVRVARSFPECRGLCTEQLEDLYQETALALLARPYQSEEHLRNALRAGIKQRALRLHRDERRRGEILAQHAPGLHRQAQARAHRHAPESAALNREDRLIVAEFLAALSPGEQRVFALLAENMQYRAIAPVLGIPVNEARNTARACERKRARFQLLYDTGRLCGYRANTIRMLQSGLATSEQLAQSAYAHLAACSACRNAHKTNARRLRAAFGDHAAALLPVQLFAQQIGALQRLALRVRLLAERYLPGGMPGAGGLARERAAALVAGSGAAGKIAAGIATVAVITGSTIGVRSALEHPNTSTHHRAAHRSTVSAPVASGVASPSAAQATSGQSSGYVQAPGRSLAHAKPAPVPASPAVTQASAPTHEPGGFAYLGVPSGATNAQQNAAQARASSVEEPHEQAQANEQDGPRERADAGQAPDPGEQAQAANSSKGGPFSP
ncbi:MAG TPA: sigma-70 family RNA polymerase sigma factor [Solirubrobacteraceae bacterium]|nr:sigma-70 family RNA polymerase sigma factor [Solirubrobacteraceae bacterium]